MENLHFSYSFFLQKAQKKKKTLNPNLNSKGSEGREKRIPSESAQW